MPIRNDKERLAYNREYNRSYYKKNRKKLIAQQNEKNKAMKLRLRAWVDGIKARAGCKKCGEKDHVVLSFHHRNPRTKLFDIGTAVSQCLSKKRILKEIKKCDVLCFNDHARVESAKRPSTKHLNELFEEFQFLNKVASSNPTGSSRRLRMEDKKRPKILTSTSIDRDIL